MFVGAVIVHHQMEIDLAGKFLINVSQEFQKLLMTMPRVALTDHFPLLGLQCRKQAWCAVAFVVVGHRSQTAFLHG